ncbi:RNA polymerase sigma factor [Priestia koreensis]|uniref:RNA polymerase sigma factor n=1 Tax=Priestia koreensis TaxID=284581 RepID=A0A0M0LHE9_9BACI|nr:RNA polymerase sigma factor [Priestia koreensis]KOO50406.1 hypothetical protein AMD01_01215 [Priestia koreensis]
MDGFQEELHAYMDIVQKHLIKIGANPEDAQDVAQETLYKYLVNIDSVEADKVKSWLFRVAVNHYYDMARRKQRKQKIVQSFQMEDGYETTLPEDVLLNKEKQSLIKKVLNKLKPQYRDLLVMKYGRELKYKEISDELDINVGTVKTTVHRARKKFIQEYWRTNQDV